MSDGFSMKVDEGDLRQLLGKLDGLGDLDISRALMAGGLVVEGAGKENIIYYDFIDTGATLNSTAATVVGDEIHIGPETEYAIFGELGLGGQKEKPFMREALADNKDAILQAIAAELREQIRSRT
jgi:HK97 gp10 family phage protein